MGLPPSAHKTAIHVSNTPSPSRLHFPKHTSMSGHSTSASTEKRFRPKAEDKRDEWIPTDPMKVLKGQAIQASHDAILEAIDVTSKGDAASKEEAKEFSRNNEHFCIVVGVPRPGKDDKGNDMIFIPVLHCTKSIYSYMKDVIYRPLPHSSGLWSNYVFRRAPLEATKTSSEFHHQTYVIPYRVFEVPVKPGHHAMVSRLAFCVMGKRNDISAI